MDATEMRFGDCRCSLEADMQNLDRYTLCDANRHCNACYELHICLKGTCVMGIDEKSYFLMERDAVLIAPGKYHCLKEENEKHA
ncbi:MAG: AraC family ligand binding domain-containing protein, partial [Clostridia bacterium]|nr:AraC family ligand binding domain-containing protein [Clostridia bacterium]